MADNKQTIYTPIKVNNEIELCEVSDPECKKLIERKLVENRISYYIRWPKTFILSRRRNVCIICVNDNARKQAENIVRSVCKEGDYSVRFLMRKSPNVHL